MGESAAAVAEFNCSACDRKFKWKPAIAGKKAKCGCGSVLEVPTTDPSLTAAAADRSPEPEEEFAFDVVAAESAPPPTIRVAPAAAVRTAPAATASAKKAAAKPLDYRRGPDAIERERDANASIWGTSSERIAPAILLAVSLAVFIGTTLYESTDPTFVGFMMFVAGLQVVVMTGAAFLTASFAGISFGVLGLAILRFAAVLMGVEAVYCIFDLMAIPASGYLRLAVVFAVFYGFMMWFFSLDYSDVRILAFVYIVFKIAMWFAVIGVIAGIFGLGVLD